MLKITIPGKEKSYVFCINHALRAFENICEVNLIDFKIEAIYKDNIECQWCNCEDELIKPRKRFKRRRKGPTNFSADIDIVEKT